LWPCPARREKRQAPAPPVTVTAVKDYDGISESRSPAPAKPPRTYESEMEQIENVEPAIAEAVRSSGQSTTKRQAPLPPTSLSTQELSPLDTSTPIRKVPSPVKMMKIDDNIDSPDKVTNDKIGVVETSTAPEDCQSGEASGGSKPVDKVQEKRGTNSTGHVSSATLIFGGVAAQKPTPAKVAIVQKTGPSSSEQTSVSKASSQSTADDSVVDEPTRQPVAARLAAWQTKQVVPTNQEPLAVSSRVKNYERKISTEEKTRTPAKLRPQSEAVSNKSLSVTTTKMSPIRAGVAVATNSPIKSVLTSPQKLSPATRAIQERLTQKCEAGTRNEAVDRERKERVAELADVENRWQHGPATTTPSVSYHFI